MRISGKKIVELSKDERSILKNAVLVLDSLAEAVGNEDYNFSELSETLYYIQNTEKFEVDFTQE